MAIDFDFYIRLGFYLAMGLTMLACLASFGMGYLVSTFM